MDIIINKFLALKIVWLDNDYDLISWYISCLDGWCPLKICEWTKCWELGSLQCTHSWEYSQRVLRLMSENISHSSGHSLSWCLRLLYNPVADLRAESEVNVESCFLARGHTTENSFGHFWDLCYRASLTWIRQ